jgi:hypothetical protein
MTLEIPVRPRVLEQETARLLDEFLRFRHLFRSVYGFELGWVRLRPLLERTPLVWAALGRDLQGFLVFLDEAAAAK